MADIHPSLGGLRFIRLGQLSLEFSTLKDFRDAPPYIILVYSKHAESSWLKYNP